MATPVSAFLRASGKNYLEEAANYLQARGLTIQDTPILPYFAKNHGLTDASGAPIILEGWAFCLKDSEGQPKDNQYLMRVCNYPEECYQDGKLWDKKPKFIQTFKSEFLHWEGNPRRAPLFMLHEKISSAALAHKVLGVPCLAISGCTGWSNKGSLGCELALAIGASEKGCTIAVCFDGDIVSNPNIMHSASQLKGHISKLRPDINVVFPMVPDMQFGVGWDDWAVGQGDELAANWIQALGNQVEVQDVLPLSYLIEHFGVSTIEVKKKGAIEQTYENYERLMNFPRWKDYRIDITGDTFNGGNGPIDTNKAAMAFHGWLERSICRGYGSTVKASLAKSAFLSAVNEKRASVALELLRELPVATLEAANGAALRLITEGICVVGPMTQDETVETVLRMVRDIVQLWSVDAAVDVQWALALVGPSGCGKSNFLHSLFGVLNSLNYAPRISQLEKQGGRANLVEYLRAASYSHAVVFDEYNPNDAHARAVERDIFTLSSTRSINQRKLYEESSSSSLRHALICLTTTDQHRHYIRSAEGSGERRFITLEVKGVREHSGILSSNREVIAECGEILLRWAAHGGTTDGDATEFSLPHTKRYIRNARVMSKIAESNNIAILHSIGADWKRTATGDYRFSLPMVRQILSNQIGTSEGDRTDLDNLILRAGAIYIGRARVTVKPGHPDAIKDKVYSVMDWSAFCEAIDRGLE